MKVANYGIIMGASLIGASAMATVASAGEPICADRAVFVSQLASRYEEQPVSLGLMPNGNVLEVFASQSGTFTVVISDPRGRSCIFASGEGWNDAPPTVTAQGEPL